MREFGIGFVAYSSMGRGFLSGTIKQRSDLGTGDWRLASRKPEIPATSFRKNRALVNEINLITANKGGRSSQISLAWLLAQGEDVAIIPGTKRLSYLEQN
jgi:aryl-alcohol dehydrogenase-like predicted oxidoreductase